MGKIQLRHTLTDISALENLLAAWREFEPGKRSKPDVQLFALRLFDHLQELSEDLAAGTYVHGPYQRFIVSDPKTRIIHKTCVRDRVLHRAVYRLLYPFFERTFISDSFSCRIGRGTHRALARFNVLARKSSHNHTHTLWVLKADIKKFFASINHDVLLSRLSNYIPDPVLMNLLRTIVRSFETAPGQGLPLGNLTSQLFCNIYMNRFDQFVKHKLKVPYYIRYADDFVLLSHDKKWLERQINPIRTYLREKLKLEIHPDKIWLKTLASGADFLGWVHFPYHRVLRKSTKLRVQRAMSTANNQTLRSYLGLLQHGNTFRLQTDLLNQFFSIAESDRVT